MAQGDTFSIVPTSVAAAGTLDIQPVVGAEAVIHNLYWPTSSILTISWFDGTNSIAFDTSSTTDTGRFNTHYHVTHTAWIRITNGAGGAVLLAYDGMQTK